MKRVVISAKKEDRMASRVVTKLLGTVLMVAVLVVPLAMAYDEFDLRPWTNTPIYFQGWNYRPDIVEDNVRRYNEELGGHVQYSTIAGDYSAIMETKLVVGAPLDVLYGHAYDAIRYYRGGWILPAEELPNIEQIKADMYPTIIKALSYDGKLLGLPYFTSVIGCVAVNLKLLEKVGLTPQDFPKTWDELYNQLYEVRKRGLEHPYLPPWYVEQWGIPWAFIYETLNRGGRIVDENGEPLLTADGPAGDTLRAWKRIWNDGLVPHEVLGYKEADFLEAWESGQYLYTPTMLYNLKRHNDPYYSAIAGYCSVIPYAGQPWGMLDIAAYLMTAHPRTEGAKHDVMAFTSWYGYKDHHGEFFVANRWLENSMLFSGYRPVMESPLAEAVMKKALARPEDYRAALELYEHVQYPAELFQQPWAAEFQSFLREILDEFLLKDLPVEQVIQAMRDEINRLNAMYK